MRAGQDREADDVHVLLDRRGHDLLGRLAQARVDDFHPRVPQRPGDDLGAAVVAVEAGLGDQDADGARHAGSAVYQSMIATGSPDAQRGCPSAPGRGRRAVRPGRARSRRGSRETARASPRRGSSRRSPRTAARSRRGRRRSRADGRSSGPPRRRGASGRSRSGVGADARRLERAAVLLLEKPQRRDRDHVERRRIAARRPGAQPQHAPAAPARDVVDPRGGPTSGTSLPSGLRTRIQGPKSSPAHHRVEVARPVPQQERSRRGRSTARPVSLVVQRSKTRSPARPEPWTRASSGASPPSPRTGKRRSPASCPTTSASSMWFVGKGETLMHGGDFDNPEDPIIAGAEAGRARRGCSWPRRGRRPGPKRRRAGARRRPGRAPRSRPPAAGSPGSKRTRISRSPRSVAKKKSPRKVGSSAPRQNEAPEGATAGVYSRIGDTMPARDSR